MGLLDNDPFRRPEPEPEPPPDPNAAVLAALDELRAAEAPDLAMLSVAMRELRNLASR